MPTGLSPVLARLGGLWGAPVTAGPVQTGVGPAPHVGTSRALPSSAAELRVDAGGGRHTVWVAAPELPADPARGLAPVYLHAGRRLVLPTIRLFAGDPETTAPEYLSLDHWFADAVGRWRFQPVAGGNAVTVADHLTTLAPPAGLDLLAVVVRYALFGSARWFRRHGLTFPPSAMWARPAGDTELARRSARALVVTARLDADDPAKPARPRGGLRAAAYRVRPADPRDRGIDPFHTPEGTEIRLTGRLGVGAGITPDRALTVPPGVPLGPSAARLPFAGSNDPRRLLMAANMQAQAVEIDGSEPPAVRESNDCPDPPGVNLRVAYLAWQGWNHEDAWVLSESAARKLGAVETTDVVLERRALELDEPPLVTVGQTVRRGELLFARRYAPVLLADDLPTLAALPDLDAAVPVPPEAGDVAPHDGEVAAIENWDLLDESTLPRGWDMAAGLTSRFRRAYRVTLRRHLPLTVGDKLANRHGHKGVVGLILPDDRMPRWWGEPVEALIDPISVLNRSNWGQLRETLSAPDPDRDATGRLRIDPPAVGDWLRGPVSAVAGVQFVMRLPQHAADKLAASPTRGTGLRSRPQRFGEMDRWAVWAHGLGWVARPESAKGVVRGAATPFADSGRATQDGLHPTALSPAAVKLSRLLGGAGYRLRLEDDHITFARWPLDADPPPEFEPFPIPTDESLADVYDRLDDDAPAPRALVFDPPIECDGGPVRWLPLIPAADRRPRRLADGSEEPHDLTHDLRRLVRAVRSKTDAAALTRLMADAYAGAVGHTATGADSSKTAWLRRGVLGGRVAPSGRGVITPAGALGLSLDEVGLPPPLAVALFGSDRPADVDGKTVWLKRDPVLHRWGLLALRARIVPGLTLRLLPSVIGPLGADFDGDTVAVFAVVPGADPDACRPSGLAWDGDRAMFVPGKQYVYGLHLLRKSPERAAALSAELTAAGAPPWPAAASEKAALERWVRATAEAPRPDGRWWAVIERHALTALADDPGMGLGFPLSLAELRALPAVTCGAAKNLYDDGPAAKRMTELIAGKGLDVYAAGGELDAIADPIAGVMVASKSAVGRFGGALRRLLYSLRTLTPELVRAAQTLTEQITQRALSVKAGDPPVSVGEFEAELRRLLKGEAPPPETGTPLRVILAEPRMRAVWGKLQAALGGEAPAWLAWLRAPHELREILVRDARLEIPVTDPRAGGWAGQ